MQPEAEGGAFSRKEGGRPLGRSRRWFGWGRLQRRGGPNRANACRRDMDAGVGSVCPHRGDRLAVEYLDLELDALLLGLEHLPTRVSRRQLLRRGAAALGGVAGAGAFGPSSAFAGANASPRPIPGGFDKNFIPVPKHPVLHVLPPGIGFEMSTITDFNGVVAGSETRGRAHGSDGTTYDFDTDMRFMHGTYRGLDGRMRKGAFGFI